MTDRYDEIAVAVDAERAEALRRRVHAQLNVRADHSPVEEILMMTDASDRSQRRRRYGWMAAAALLVVGAGGIAVAINATDSEPADEPVAEIPTTPSTTSTTPTTSTTAPPTLDDSEIAAATLLTASEYGTGWTGLFNVPVRLDATTAQTIPACQPYVDVVFESPSRPAEKTYFWFGAPESNVAAMTQYVVVFPDEAAAVAMFDATSEPAFADCIAAYNEPAPTDSFPPLRPSNLEPPPLELAGDEVFVRRATGSFTTEDGVVHTEDVLSATVRVGRIITILEAADPSFYPYDQFVVAVATMVDRAQAALNGDPRPR
jgi:hypothetical protein